MIRRLRKKCSKIEFIVIKQSQAAVCLGNSRPCSVCLNMMKLLNFKNVYYSDTTGNIIVEKISQMQSTHFSQMNRSLKKNEYNMLKT